MAQVQIPNLTPTLTLSNSDEILIRQGTTDKRLKLSLSDAISWGKRKGYTFLGEHSSGVIFSDFKQFTYYSGKVYFLKGDTSEGSIPYESIYSDPSSDTNLTSSKQEDVAYSINELENIDVSTNTEGKVVTLTAGGRSGQFVWTLGDFTTQVAADTQQGIYIASSLVSVTVGCWVRALNGYVTPEMFGLSQGDDVSILNSILTILLKVYALEINFDLIFSETLLLTTSEYSGLKIVFNNNSRLLPASDAISWLYVAGIEDTTNYTLSADALEGQNYITSTSAPGTINIGDYVFIKSDDYVFGGDYDIAAFSNLRGQIAKVVDIDGDDIYFDTTLDYEMLTTSNATLNAVDMIEGVTLVNPTLNKLDYDNLLGVGLNIKFACGVTIVNPRAFASKQPFIDESGVSAYEGRSAITLQSCLNVEISKPNFKQIAWYGIGLTGACRDVTVYDVTGSDMRHLFDVTWFDGYGEPCNVNVINGKSSKTTLAGFSTHTVGREITYTSCNADSSVNDSGFRIRSKNVKLVNPISYNNALDGIVTSACGLTPEITNPDTQYNGRNGIATLGGGVIRGGKSKWNATSDISTSGGIIDGTEISKLADGTYPIFIYSTGTVLDVGQTQLDVKVSVTRSSDSLTGDLFMYGDSGVDLGMVTVHDSYIPDFVQGEISAIYTGGISGGSAPIVNNNVLFSDPSYSRGKATLVAGTVDVTGIYYGARLSASPYYSPKIKVRKFGWNASDGALSVKRLSYTSFRITSTDTGDTDTVEWEMCD